MNQSDFARRHGVSRKTVTAWKRQGLLVMRGGAVDVAASDARLRDAGRGGLPDAIEGAGVDAADGDMAEALAPETIDSFLSDLLAGRFGSQATAERIKENALAGLRALELRVKAGALIERETAEAVFFEVARSARDAWLAWPSRVAPLLAAELGVAPDRLAERLSALVVEHLAQQGEPEVAFDGGAA